MHGGAKKYGGITDMAEMRANLRMSCLPETLLDGEIPDFGDFLEARRKLMAAKIKTYFEGLCDAAVGKQQSGGERKWLSGTISSRPSRRQRPTIVRLMGKPRRQSVSSVGSVSSTPQFSCPFCGKWTTS